MAYRIALLDFDGTLAATRPAVVACMRVTLAEHGFAMPEEAAVEEVIAAGISLDQAVARLVPELSPQEIPACVAAYRANYPAIDVEHTRLFDGAADVLAQFARAGIETVVISNKGRLAVEATLARFRLPVTAVVGAEPGLPAKPDPALFTAHVAPLFPASRPGDYLMVGDTPADLAFAHAAGIDAAYARFGYGADAECLALEPRHVIASLGELPAIVLA